MCFGSQESELATSQLYRSSVWQEQDTRYYLYKCKYNFLCKLCVLAQRLSYDLSFLKCKICCIYVMINHIPTCTCILITFDNKYNFSYMLINSVVSYNDISISVWSMRRILFKKCPLTNLNNWGNKIFLTWQILLQGLIVPLVGCQVRSPSRWSGLPHWLASWEGPYFFLLFLTISKKRHRLTHDWESTS